MGQCLNGCPRSQVRSSDSDHDQDIRILAYLLGSFLDTAELLFVVCVRELNPSQVIAARPAFFMEHIVGRKDLGLQVTYFMLADKAQCVFVIKSQFLSGSY